MHHERKFPLRYGRGELVVRWRDTNAGPKATLRFNDRPLKVTWRRTEIWRGQTRSQELPHEQAPLLDEFPARGLVDDIDTLDIVPEPTTTGIAAIGASLDPANWRGHRFIVTGGHYAHGVVYNSSVTSSRRIRIEIDVDAMTATYIEHSNFDDG